MKTTHTIHTANESTHIQPGVYTADCDDRYLQSSRYNVVATLIHVWIVATHESTNSTLVFVDVRVCIMRMRVLVDRLSLYMHSYTMKYHANKETHTQ